MTPFWPIHPHKQEFCAHWSGCFDDNELDEIVRIGQSKEMVPSSVNYQNGSTSTDDKLRKGNVSFITPTDSAHTYEVLSWVVNKLNEDYFNYELTGFGEFLQFAEYKEGDYINSHLDMGATPIPRKLTMSVQLSDEDDYEGGDLEVMTSAEHPLKLSRQRGTVLLFPSYIMHRVTPVTSGIRHSLVGWVTGPQFR